MNEISYYHDIIHTMNKKMIINYQIKLINTLPQATYFHYCLNLSNL